MNTWQSDLGNGIYRNPVLFADYSDPDVIRVNDRYYMTASSFNFTPGLPILVSGDLVNWELKNYALRNIPGEEYTLPRHSCGVWAPAIRYQNGWFYIFYGMPDEGIYMVRTRDALKEWEEPVLVLAGKGLIDPCPLWDDDGRAYVVHAYAKSRAGFNSVLGMFEINPEGTKAVGADVQIFDGTRTQKTIEGPKIYKRNGWYYIFAPAGGVKQGWQTVLRSRRIGGPYEERIVMRQGDTPVNGPHQGALVDTCTGEWWFLHFQDRGAYGRIVHLQPAVWEDGWCIIGKRREGRVFGEPYLFHKKPLLPPQKIAQLSASDGFSGERLSLIWQWLGNHREDFFSLRERPGWLRLNSRNLTGETPAVLWNCPNVLTQKMVCPEFTLRTRLDASGLARGERAGLLAVGDGYAALELFRGSSGLTVRYIQSEKTEAGMSETVLREWKGAADREELTLSLSIELKDRGGAPAVCASFFFETEEHRTYASDRAYEMSPHTWVGAKTGLYAVSDAGEGGGWADFAWVRCEREKEEENPVFEMVEAGELEAVKYMAEYSKTSMNEKDAKGKTLLHYAARSGNTELVRYLTERVGLSFLAGDRNLLTPFEEARLEGQRETEAYFAARAGAPLAGMYKNPVRPGMYPDPSIVRIGEDYYMVNSTFVYFPCIPVSHSRDLVNWEIIGYAVEHSEWARLEGLEGGRGYWAPDISWSNGRFYITASLRLNDDGITLRRQMIVSAERPEGPYSEPVFIEEEGIDPSLFHDDDGRHYMLLNRGARILELNGELTKQISEARLLYYGDHKRAPEGPHLLKKDGYYYLFLAEGGTGMGHMVTAARAESLEGPFEPCPWNPILTQTDGNAGLQCCGHAKPVSTPDGRWFLVFLLGRYEEGYTILGRETGLIAMEWTADGWPLVRGGRNPEALALAPFAGTVQKPDADWREEIFGKKLSLEWMSPRRRRNGAFTVTERGVRIAGDRWDLDSLAAGNLLLRRQTASRFKIRLCMEMESFSGESAEAGMTCYYDENTWIKFGVRVKDGESLCFLEENRGRDRRRTDLGKAEIRQGELRISCSCEGLKRSFSLADAAGKTFSAEVGCAAYLCDEGYSYGKRFTGPMTGVYALGEKTYVLVTSFRTKNLNPVHVLLNKS